MESVELDTKNSNELQVVKNEMGPHCYGKMSKLKQLLAGHDLSGFTQEQIDVIEKILISTINDCSDFIVSNFDFCGEEILIAESLSEVYQTDWSYDDDHDSVHES